MLSVVCLPHRGTAATGDNQQLLMLHYFVLAVKALYVMGGSAHKGNITPTAEFNFHCDPEAAHLVLKKVSLCLCAQHRLMTLATQQCKEDATSMSCNMLMAKQAGLWGSSLLAV